MGCAGAQARRQVRVTCWRRRNLQYLRDKFQTSLSPSVLPFSSAVKATPDAEHSLRANIGPVGFRSFCETLSKLTNRSGRGFRLGLSFVASAGWVSNCWTRLALLGISVGASHGDWDDEIRGYSRCSRQPPCARSRARGYRGGRPHRSREPRGSRQRAAGSTTNSRFADRAGFPSIRGDQDRRLVEFDIARTGAHRGDYLQLDRKHLNWLASLPPTMVYRDEVFLCHGTPRSDTACWLDLVTDGAVVQASPIQNVEAEASGIAASLILCGHTHIPRVVRLRDGRFVVNPGSIGCPGYDGHVPVLHQVHVGTPHACYAILERESLGWSVAIRYVPYDHMSMAEMARRNGLSTWASALATGWTT